LMPMFAMGNKNVAYLTRHGPIDHLSIDRLQ
jgi:hypothetical protein